ncbi:MAG: hypothetical protein SVR08_03135 [Spirochaetota bacterium]|nr:hypothetical protein [Spirochaetota bacterium]
MTFNSNNYLLEMINDLFVNNIDFIIAGGVALVLHGIERMTLDLDISVSMTESNLNKLIITLKNMGLTPRVPVPAESLLDPVKRRSFVTDKNAMVFTFIDTNNPFRQIDIFLTDDLSYNALIDDTDILTINNNEIYVLTKNKLLELKERIDPKRDKDIFDINQLKKLMTEY